MNSYPDPSHGIARDLLAHVHLISTWRYTQKAFVDIPEVTNWLLQAPQIARDKAPFFWTYLDRPENGTITLTWQASQQMGTTFASDGYIWPPAEQRFTSDIGNGVMLEMYYHRAGYAIGEQTASHSRRRFRLCPPSIHNPNAPQVDPSLWIVHYGPVENNDRVPAQLVPQDPRTRSILEQRAYLQRCGQIQRKEFILSDRVNWPQIAWPREATRQAMYAGNRGVPQTIAYPPHPPNKRARTAQAGHGQVQAGGAPVPPVDPSIYDDDEDTSRGDFFDHLTPRDVSAHRYQQNHDWMEEILSSPYRMDQIVFPSLGFGLKGELSGLTDGIYDAPGADVVKQLPGRTNTTHLDPELAAEFRKRVDERIEATNAEIAKMKAAHEERIAMLKKNSLLMTAEKDLRGAVDNVGLGTLPSETRSENQEGGSPRLAAKRTKKIEDIVAQVEAQLGRRAEVIYDLKRIQDGGYQEPAPVPEHVAAPPTAMPDISQSGAAANGSDNMSRQLSRAGSQHSGITMGDSDVDMGGTAAGLLDQMHTGLSNTSTPANNFPTPQGQVSAVQSNAATPANLNVPSPRPTTGQQPPLQAAPSGSEDVAMTGTDTQPSANMSPDQGTNSGDWVVVPRGGVTPDPNVNASNTETPSATAEPVTKAPSQPPSQPTSRQPSAMGTPAAASIGFSAGDDNDFGSLGDLDTAGDALASFHDTPASLSNDFMDDSAFGDAFHGVEASGHDTGTPGDGNL